MVDSCGRIVPFAFEQKSVWLLCTNEVWPGDLSMFLWHFYGGMISVDLREFREATRDLLDEYTAHYKRQNVVDLSMQQKAKHAFRSLSHLVHLDRMDRVVAQ